MSLPICIKRDNPIPLDDSSIWYNFTDLQNYAVLNPTAYVGQILSFVDETAKTAKAYIILDTNGTLQEIGSGSSINVNTDNKTIQISNNNLMLKDFGLRYYRYIPATETQPSSYVLQEVSPEFPWRAGLEPKVASIDNQLVLAWYEPNLSTSQGIGNELAQLKITVNDLNTIVNNHSTTIGSTTDQNSILGQLDNLNKKFISSIKIGNSTLTPNLQHEVTLPTFNGTQVGLVPQMQNNLDSKSNYFLNANGDWATPIDPRIGNLTYNEIKYNNIQDYVAAVSADALQWEELK